VAERKKRVKTGEKDCESSDGRYDWSRMARIKVRVKKREQRYQQQREKGTHHHHVPSWKRKTLRPQEASGEGGNFPSPTSRNSRERNNLRRERKKKGIKKYLVFQEGVGERRIDQEEKIS